MLGEPSPDPEKLAELLMAFHPWRKGPLNLGGVTIDTEWRSDWKWARIAPHVDLEGATVLDVGCGNGYFGWRMLGQGARCVVGIDPTVLFVMQWLAQVHFAGVAPNYVLPLRDTDLPRDVGAFDRVFSLGVLYHRRDPDDHLARLRDWCAPGGQLVLETLVVDRGPSLEPTGRYARMRNVHEVPTVERLLERVGRAGFEDAVVVDQTRTTTGEQRSTPWMRFESLKECLDPDDPGLTVEGHPAPLRTIVVARAKGPA
jgi:tRNA (mo5U34)-methyltransferase